jgi:hypothetical protein
MKRSLFLILFCSLLIFDAFSQKVDSIKVEQSGDFIKIRYKILNSTPDQVYRVRVYFSVNGGLNQEIRSISGDVGDQVIGGKSEYWAVWDVLKDVEEIKAVEFVVRAEIVKDISVPGEKEKVKSKHIVSLIAAAQLPGPGFGARLSFLGKFGVSLQAVSGKGSIDDPVYTDDPSLKRFSLDLASRIANKNTFQTHLLTGITVGQAVIKDTYNGSTSYPTHFAPGLELGAVFSFNRFNLMLAASKLLTNMTEEGDAISKTTNITIGLGIRF